MARPNRKPGGHSPVPPTSRSISKKTNRRRRPIIYDLKPGDMLEFHHSGRRAREKVVILPTDGVRVRKVKVSVAKSESS